MRPTHVKSLTGCQPDSQNDQSLDDFACFHGRTPNNSAEFTTRLNTPLNMGKLSGLMIWFRELATWWPGISCDLHFQHLYRRAINIPDPGGLQLCRTGRTVCKTLQEQ